MDDITPDLVTTPATLDTVQAAMDELRAVAVSLAAKADTQQGILDRLDAAQRIVDENRRYSHTSRWIAMIAIVAAVLSVGSGGFNVYLYVVASHNTSNIQQVQARTSSQVWCPLYQVLDKALAGPPAPGATPTQLAIRQGLIDVVNAGKPALHCSS